VELPRLVHIETRNMRTGRCVDVDLGFEKPRRLKLPRDCDDSLGTVWDFITSGKNWGADFQRHVDDSSPWMSGGYMLWNSDHTVRCHCMPAQYKRVRAILDSVQHPSMRFRFMCMVKDERWADIQTLLTSLPHIERDYMWANSRISMIIKKLYELYRDIYVFRKCIVMTREQWRMRHMIFRIHGIYLNRAKLHQTRDIDIFDIVECVLKLCSRFELWDIGSEEIEKDVR
jgi:hypothetical protein